MSEMYPNISVIIPAYNEEQSIGRCIEAIVIGSYPRAKIELILVDNNSTDGTVDACVGQIDVLVQNTTQGAYESRNVGAARASSDYLFFVDADTLVSPNLFVDSVAKLNGGCVAGTCRKVPSIPSIYHRLIWTAYDVVDLLWVSAIQRPYNFFAAFCFSDTRVFKAVGGFRADLGVNADHIYARDAAKHGRVEYVRSGHIVFSLRRLSRVGYLTYWIRTKLGLHLKYPDYR